MNLQNTDLKTLVQTAQVQGLSLNQDLPQATRSIVERADQAQRQLSSDELTTICQVSGIDESLADNLIQRSDQLVNQARAHLIATPPHLVHPGGALHPPDRAEACGRDCWNFLRVITYAVACNQSCFTNPSGMAALRELDLRDNALGAAGGGASGREAADAFRIAGRMFNSTPMLLIDAKLGQGRSLVGLGDLEGGEKVYTKTLNLLSMMAKNRICSAEAVGPVHVAKAHLLAARGEYDDAFAELAKAEKLLLAFDGKGDESPNLASVRAARADVLLRRAQALERLGAEEERRLGARRRVVERRGRVGVALAPARLQRRVLLVARGLALRLQREELVGLGAAHVHGRQELLVVLVDADALRRRLHRGVVVALGLQQAPQVAHRYGRVGVLVPERRLVDRQRAAQQLSLIHI